MKTIMNFDKLTTITELEQFLDGSQTVAFSILDHKQSKYSFIKKTLVKRHYACLHLQSPKRGSDSIFN